MSEMPCYKMNLKSSLCWTFLFCLKWSTRRLQYFVENKEQKAVFEKREIRWRAKGTR